MFNQNLSWHNNCRFSTLVWSQPSSIPPIRKCFSVIKFSVHILSHRNQWNIQFPADHKLLTFESFQKVLGEMIYMRNHGDFAFNLISERVDKYLTEVFLSSSMDVATIRELVTSVCHGASAPVQFISSFLKSFSFLWGVVILARP